MHRTVPRTSARLLTLVLLLTGLLRASVEILPTPQYQEVLEEQVNFSRGRTVQIRTGPVTPATDRKGEIAAEFLTRAFRNLDAGLATETSAQTAESVDGAVVQLWNYALDQNPPIRLNFLDRHLLGSDTHGGQSYVIRTPDDRSIWIIGSSSQGVLLGTMSVLQMLRKEGDKVTAPAVYIRDYPDFEFRTASDWLLRIELSHWALDRGQGIEAFARLCERKLDRALRFKINMVLFDGFGWGLDDMRFPGYSALMVRLNRYARERGIHLIFGGYGAAYDLASSPGQYLGKVFENRESYPDGAVYQCPGPPLTGHGTCRANEELNRLKADELRRFVEGVEPGALYIHHEDCCSFEPYRQAWLSRCERCRKRWPNDSFSAADGGAGALAYGYKNLIETVNGVKREHSGFQAARDTQIILVSPVYMPAGPESTEWSNVLELWRNITAQLPAVENVQVGLREVFPQDHGGKSWVEQFNAAVRDAGRSFGSFLFFIGGADNFLTDYPLTGSPALNASFYGARSIYNATGDFYQEPMEILNAEYSWNIRSRGFFRDPEGRQEGWELWQRYMYTPDQPTEIFGSGGLYEKVCRLLYGEKAGPIMASYYRESEWMPDRDSLAPENSNSDRKQITYLPSTWDRLYAVPLHWLHFRADSPTWVPEITDERYLSRLRPFKIDTEELHRRLARRWNIASRLNRKGADLIQSALTAQPLPESKEDLEFLETTFQVYDPLLRALAQFHEATRLRLGGEERNSLPLLESAARDASEARERASKAFPRPIDPMGADVGNIAKYAEQLIESISALEGK